MILGLNGHSPDIESQHEDHDDAEHGSPIQPGHHHPVTAIQAPAWSSENNLHTSWLSLKNVYSSQEV